MCGGSGGSVYVESGGGVGSADGESTNPDLYGLQAGCTDSVLRKGISVSNGSRVEENFL